MTLPPRASSIRPRARVLRALLRLDPALAAARNSPGDARWIAGAPLAAIEAWRRAHDAVPLCLEAARNLQRQQEVD